MLAGIILATGILLLIVAGYQALKSIKVAQRIRRQADGFLSVNCQGDCGSAFEFMLSTENGRVRRVEVKGGRCAHSLICARAAASLAEGLAPAQLKTITARQIAQNAGGLSPEHMHCALLAAHGLSRAAQALENENSAA